jgi:hypothetical protein
VKLLPNVALLTIGRALRNMLRGSGCHNGRDSVCNPGENSPYDEPSH